MSIKEKIQKSGYLSSCGTMRITSLSLPSKRSKVTCRHTMFVEGLLGATASLEASLENPAAW